MIPTELPRLLISWYRNARRDLPWRKTRDAYAVMVSELMLQQTRVETVIPYYRRFLAELPDVAALSRVADDALLKLWQGLGYYRRAAMLKQAAQVIMEKYDGVFPSDYESIRRLPGIGDYTAGAIASIAFGQPRAAVDGNVLRVISRVTDDDRDVFSVSSRRRIAGELESLYPENAASDFTQSLMELGATVCLPNGAPRCDVCPVKTLCLAEKNGTIALRPMKKVQKARKVEKKTLYFLTCNGRIALMRRPGQGVLANLYGFPEDAGFLTPAGIQKRHANWHVSGNALAAKHVFTHLEWHMRWFCAESDQETADFIWVTHPELEQKYPIPTAFSAYRKLADIVKKES